MNFTGSLTAIVTPFGANGGVDKEAFVKLIEWQIEQGIDGIVVVGTTGESPTLSHDEHGAVIELCVKTVAGRVPVIAGTGSNATSEAITMSRHAADGGADALLLVNPYYNKPSQEGLLRHYRAIADAVAIPQFIYNIPGRTAGKVELATLVKLAAHKNIIGVKDAVGDLAETKELIDRVDPDFIILSGDDALTVPMMEMGGKGVISVLANVMPKTAHALTAAALDGDWATARELEAQTAPLVSALFVETNPVPVKTALALMGHCAEEFRLPLCALAETSRAKLVAELKNHNLI